MGATTILALVVAVNLLDLGLKSGQIANQTRIFTSATIRARVNTVYMVGVFGGGAFGSLAGTMAWHFAGWHGACDQIRRRADACYVIIRQDFGKGTMSQGPAPRGQ